MNIHICIYNYIYIYTANIANTASTANTQNTLISKSSNQMVLNRAPTYLAKVATNMNNR